jgi:lysine/arginine/ornithine transport system substrate-binding protein
LTARSSERRREIVTRANLELAMATFNAFRRSLVPLLLVFSFFVLAGVRADAEEVLRIGLEASYPPFESKTPAGKLQGFDVDVANAVCARLKMHCVWVENAFDGLIPALSARKFDLIDSAMNITAARKQAIAFTDPVYVVPMQMIARRDSHLQPDAVALKGRRVGVLQGSAQEEFAKEHWATAGVEVVSYAAQDQIYPDLVAGRLDASVQEAQTAQDGFLNQAQGRDFDFAGPPLRDSALLGDGVGLGVRQSDRVLLARVNAALASLKADGTLSELSRRYFKRDIIAR